jgi:hypothetical protein
LAIQILEKEFPAEWFSFPPERNTKHLIRNPPNVYIFENVSKLFWFADFFPSGMKKITKTLDIIF